MKLRTKLKWKLNTILAWYYRRQGCVIGKDCQISTTTKIDLTNPEGVVIGDYTAISFRTAILTHDFINQRHLTTRIGSNCFVGANSLIMPGVNIGDNSIVGAGSVVYTNVPANSIVSGNPARVVRRGVDIGRYGILRSTCGVNEPDPLPKSSKVRPVGVSNSEIDTVFANYFDGVNETLPLSETGVDSFALITMRAEIEEVKGEQIDDDDWAKVNTPRDIRALMIGGGLVPTAIVDHSTAKVRRRYELNMPQMSMKGLSESWLFKEIGDIHWSMITGSLKVKSSEIADQNGNRLYATFISFSYESTMPISQFAENEVLEFNAEMKRFGAGLFFADTTVMGSAGGRIKVKTASSFAKFGQEGDNLSLVKGQPAIPANFAIGSIDAKPETLLAYQAARSASFDNHVFHTQYDIVPIHDINGVGLLYFAAYPIIIEICTSRHPSYSIDLSPLKREIKYFANSGSGLALDFYITKWDETALGIVCECFLVRPDGKIMAVAQTEYVRRPMG